MVPNPGASTPRRHCKCGRFIPTRYAALDNLADEQPYTTYLVADRIKASARNPRLRALTFLDIARIVDATFHAIHASASNNSEPVSREEVAA